MSRLFEPINLGGITVRNRIAKSAMVEGLGDERGRATAAMVALYERWAKGGVGLAITGMVTIIPGFSVTAHEVGLWEDAQIEPLRAVVEATHRHGSRILVQLCHAPPQLTARTARRFGNPAPSAGVNRVNLMPSRALRDDELLDIARAFGDAARRARDAGADGVELHAAHGYLLSRMLSPLHNRRRDDWGGNFDRRMALLEQVLRSIRSQAGADFPVAVKLNAHDGEVKGGLSLDQSARVAARLERSGVVAIEVSAGTADVGLSFYPNRGGIPRDLARQFLREQVGVPRLGLPLLEPLLRHAEQRVAFSEEAYFLDEARRIAEAVSIPVIAVGGIRSRDKAERILNQTRVSMVSLARPLVREPDLVREWEADREAVASCTSCNRCYVALGLGYRLQCRAQAGA